MPCSQAVRLSTGMAGAWNFSARVIRAPAAPPCQDPQERGTPAEVDGTRTEEDMPRPTASPNPILAEAPQRRLTIPDGIATRSLRAAGSVPGRGRLKIAIVS